MSDYYAEIPVELRRRGRAKNVAGRGNRVVGWPVVQVVGTSRAFVAVLAAGVVLSGCASAEGEGGMSTTTSPPSVETSGNPWDLPIEQRPALFDPCAEIPVEAVEQALGAPVKPVDEFTRHQPGSLMACGWESHEAQFTVLSTWKSRGEYLVDRMFEVRDTNSKVADRAGLRLSPADDELHSNCIQLLFTSLGTIWLEIGLVNTFNEFKGARTADSCSVIEEAIAPSMPFVPEGEFQ